MNTILLLEDDIELNQTLTSYLEKEGYAVLSAHNCKDGRALVNTNAFEIALLDINLSDGTGFEFCKWLKEHNNVPVLFLSARDLEEDILNGYELGATDYITKPFSLKILLKKIELILKGTKELNIYDDGFLNIDFELGTIKIGNIVNAMTPTEYKILKKLIEHKGQLLTYEILLNALWDQGIELSDKHTLAVNINRIRKKIEGEGHSYISNVYGMGYIWK